MAKKKDKEASSALRKVSAPPDIKMKAFSTSDNVEETSQLWAKWKKELMTRFRYFRVDALNIYGGNLIEELVDTLPEVQAMGSELEQQSEFEKTIAKLDKYFLPLANVDSARSKFAEMSQIKEESISQYHVRLRTQANKCSFPDINDAIRSKILQTMKDGILRREAMVKKYTLNELLMHAANKEDIDRQAKSIEQSSQATRQDVHRVYEKKRLYGKRKSNRRRESRGLAAEQQHTDRTCTSCGLMHGVSTQCPAKGKKCLNCSKTGHFARMCRGPKTRPRQHPKQEWPSRPRDKLKTYYMEEGEPNAVKTQQSKQDSSSDSDFVFQTKTNSGRKRILPTVGVKINDVKGQVEADSCSTVNIIDEEKFQRLQSSSTNKLKLTPTNTKVYPYGQGKPLPLIGCFETEIESLSTGNKMTASFLVVKGSTNSRPLISLETSIELGVLMITNTMQTPSTSTAQPLLESMTFNQSQSASVDQASPKSNDAISDHLLDTYADVFSGLGKHKKMKARLVVDESVAPVIHKQRKIPYNLREKARKEEQRLMEMGIIEAVPGDQPTTWCTNPVIASKPHNPDAIRYCSDMRAPNTTIKRPITEVPTVTDIKFKLEGAKVFSVLDMNEGYHQLELEENSRHLTTFYGSRQKMRYTRLNYGTISAQDIFDKTMDDTIEGLDGVLHIRDDFIVYGKNNQEHDDALEAFLQRFRECGLTLNPKKCKFRVPEIEF